MKGDKERLLRNIEKLSERYYCEYLKVDNSELMVNWWSALEFLFEHTFARGRRDELSDAYYRFTIGILKDFFKIESEDLEGSYSRLVDKKDLFNSKPIMDFRKKHNVGRGNSISCDSFRKEVAEENSLIERLIPPKSCPKNVYYLGNDEDVMMVLDVLKLISDVKKKNIYKYLRDTVEKYGAEKASQELKSLRAVSDKIAAFVIRDIGLLNLEIIKAKDYEYAFPVDVWVAEVSKSVGCTSKVHVEIRKFFIDKCKELSLSPPEVAAGLWFLGSQSFVLAIEYLERKEVVA